LRIDLIYDIVIYCNCLGNIIVPLIMSTVRYVSLLVELMHYRLLLTVYSLCLSHVTLHFTGHFTKKCSFWIVSADSAFVALAKLRSVILVLMTQRAGTLFQVRDWAVVVMERNQPRFRSLESAVSELPNFGGCLVFMPAPFNAGGQTHHCIGKSASRGLSATAEFLAVQNLKCVRNDQLPLVAPEPLTTMCGAPCWRPFTSSTQNPNQSPNTKKRCMWSGTACHRNRSTVKSFTFSLKRCVKADGEQFGHRNNKHQTSDFIVKYRYLTSSADAHKTARRVQGSVKVTKHCTIPYGK